MDHLPIVLVPHPLIKNMKRPFHFIKAWSEDPSCFSIVQLAWYQETKRGMASHILGTRLNNTAKALSAWNRNHFGLAHRRIREIEYELKTGCLNGERGRLTQRSLEDDLRYQRRCLVLIYAQKSRELWLSEGDRNSHFFYTRITMRRRRNFVGSILDGNYWLKTPPQTCC